MFDWEDMRAFLALAQTGSLTSAARMLGVNHATIGRRIASLETNLKMTLLDRASRRTALTSEGTAVAARAEEMSATANSVLELARPETGLSGSLTLSSPPVLAGAFVIPAIAPLRAANPNLQITVSAVPALPTVERGHVDLAIRLVRPELPLHLLRRLGSIEFALYAAPELAEMMPEDWSFVGYAGELDHLTQHRWLSDYAGQRPTLFRTTDMFGQLAAVRAGMGVALLPRFIADEARGLVRVDTGQVPPRRSIWLSIHGDFQKSPAVRATADHIVRAFGESRYFSGAVTE